MKELFKGKTFAVYALLLISIYACSNKRDQEDLLPPAPKKITINIKEHAKVSDTILTNEVYIPLETTDESLIGKLDKLIMSDKTFFILDRYLSKGLFVFDSNGQFLYKIGRRGKGPGEIREYRDFDIDEKSNQIYILDYLKILVYTIEGEFLKEIPIKWPALSFCILDEGNLFLYMNDKVSHMEKEASNGFHIVKTNLKLADPKYFIKARRMEVTKNYRFYKWKGSVYIHSPQFGDYTIYKIDGDDLIPFLKFDFPHFNFDLNNYTESSDIRKNLMPPKNSVNLSTVWWTDNFIQFNCELNGMTYSGYYFNNDDKASVGYAIKGLPIPLPFVLDIEGDSVISSIDAFIIAQKFKTYNSSKNEEFETYLKANKSFASLQDMPDNNNPVIVIYKVKSE